MTEKELERHNAHMTLHKFAQGLIDRHTELVVWKGGEILNWCDEIEKFINKEYSDG